MKRLNLVVSTLLLATAAGAQDPANIVLLFADDLGYGSISAYGGAGIPTPNIDSIGEQGVRFVSGYMTAPVCNPSRNGLITGRYQQRWGKELNSQTVPPIGAARGTLGVHHRTIGDALQSAGYTTAAIGKWQLGMRRLLHPLDRGFDYFYGMPSGMNYIDPSWAGVHALEMKAEEGSNPDRIVAMFKGREQDELKEYQTTQLAREGVEFIDRNNDRPFFLYLPFYAVHAPMQVMDEHYQRFPDFDDQNRRVYAGMVSALDDAVGMVLAKLEEHGLTGNTLVIFTADNGAMVTYDTERIHNSPLIGHKRNLYEGGIRVPFLMRFPGRIPAGTVYEPPISSLDLFATSASLAGVPNVERYQLDGVDLLPYLSGEQEGAPHEYLFWRSGPNAAVRHGSWKLLMAGGAERLYDVDRDPGESEDLAAANPDVVAKLKEAFARWTEEIEDGRMSPPARRATTTYNGDTIEWHI